MEDKCLLGHRWSLWFLPNREKVWSPAACRAKPGSSLRERCIPVFLPAHEVPSSPHRFPAEGGWRHLSPFLWASRIAWCPNSSLSTMSPITQHTSPNLWSPSCSDSQLSDFSLSQGQAWSFLPLLRRADLALTGTWAHGDRCVTCWSFFFFILVLLSKTYFYVWMFVSLGHFNRWVLYSSETS